MDCCSCASYSLWGGVQLTAARLNTGGHRLVGVAIGVSGNQLMRRIVVRHFASKNRNAVASTHDVAVYCCTAAFDVLDVWIYVFFCRTAGCFGNERLV